MFTQQRSYQIYKENLGGLQESYKQQYTHVGNFNTPLSTMDRSSKQRINKNILAPNDTLHQMGLTDIQNLSPQRCKIYILFKCTQNFFKDRPHDRTQYKPQHIQENWNHIKHFLSLQWLQTRYQPQGKNSKTLKFMETELHTIKQWMG